MEHVRPFFQEGGRSGESMFTPCCSLVVCVEQLILSAGMTSPRVRIRVVDLQGGVVGDDLGQKFVSEGADVS